ncbi:type II secretion system F family protein [Streptomyces fructofermentans]|uniref:type II secretion system F family protein n=1 Tax=Streptomyces fructofermentans TaxID=152141 RepID=UPI0037B3D5CE
MAGTAGFGEVSVGVAVAAAGVAAWLMGGRGPGVRRARLVCAGGAAAGGGVGDGGVSTGFGPKGVGPKGVGPPSWSWTRSWTWSGVCTWVVGARESLRGLHRTRGEWWAPVAGLAVGLLGESVLPLVVGALAVPLVRRARSAGAERRAAERRAGAVVALCGALAAEVRAGRQPGEALRGAARDSGGLGDAQAVVLAAARFGGDVPAALIGAARHPGAEGLLGLAACWRVAVDRGAGLAAGLDRLEGALRAERDQRADLRAQLAGAGSTAVLLAGLPVLGLLLGTALGADPLRVVLHTGPGLACLLVGGALECAGLWWALRIVTRAEAG